MTKVSLALPKIMLALLLIVAPDAWAQQSDDEILLGGIQLRLGMDMSEALEKLGTVYDVEHLDEAPGVWSVFRRGGTTFDEMLGTLQFRDEQLSFVHKFWRPSDQSPRALATTLYYVIESVLRGGPRPCDPGATSYEGRPAIVSLRCGSRTIELSVTGSGPSMFISEMLLSPLD